jgi:hypothetical protein
MTQKITFTAPIENPGGGAFVRIPFDVEQTFGEKRVPVKAMFSGEPYAARWPSRPGGPSLAVRTGCGWENPVTY